MSSARSWALASVLLAPGAIGLGLALGAIPNRSLVVPQTHFLVVTVVAAISFAVALVVLSTAFQIADARVLSLALAFLLSSGLFVVHGLATPGMIAPGSNGWVGASAHFALFAGAWFLSASTLESRPAFHRLALTYRSPLVLGTGALLLLYGAVVTNHLVLRSHGTTVAILDTLERGASFLTSGLPGHVLGASGMVLCGLAAVHYWRIERRWSSPLARGLLVATVFLAYAELTMLLAPVWSVSWWTYHLWLLLGYLAALGGLVREYALHGSWRGVLEGLLLRDALEHLERGYTDVLAALCTAVEAKDVYTKGHSVRVARLAALIARELGLPPERERLLYRAGILHDIGKIGIPDAILQKPGRLTPEEFALIREHPIRSWEIARQVRSFAPLLGAIRWHHERLDGSGYPDGLRGERIPLEARILAVADVFDALTSVRPYRAALSVTETLAVLRSEAGSKLDPACVSALERVLERYGAALMAEPDSLSGIDIETVVVRSS